MGSHPWKQKMAKDVLLVMSKLDGGIRLFGQPYGAEFTQY